MGARLAVAVAGVLAAVTVGWLFLRGRPAPPSAGLARGRDAGARAALDPRGRAAARTIRVSTVSGHVTRQRGNEPAQPLAVGDQLAADDVVHTEDGSAGLSVGDLADVQVAPATRVSIAELTDTLSRVKLANGRVSAVVHGAEDATLEVEVPGSAAVARSQKGEFSVLTSGDQLAVATRSGRVTLSAHGHTVEVGTGQQSVVAGGQPPTAPDRIPPSLFLKLGKPRATLQREAMTVVRGTTAPGAVISINGVRIGVGATGEFSTPVPLKEGENSLLVETEDAAGRRAQASLPSITVDSRAPDVRSSVKW